MTKLDIALNNLKNGEISIPKTATKKPNPKVEITYLDKKTENTTKNTVNLEEFEQMLKNHDWNYHYSDDSRVFWAGEKSYQKIKEIAQELGDIGQELLFKYLEKNR